MRLPSLVVTTVTVLLIVACAAPPPESATTRTGQMRDPSTSPLRNELENDEGADHAAASLRREASQASGVVSPAVQVHAGKLAIPASVCCAPVLPVDAERYQHFDDGSIHLAASDPVSTFSIDVDTGAYANVRRFLRSGTLPPQDAVRVEELLNYFDYAYPVPTSVETPFAVSTELGTAPWNDDALLLRIGIRGYALPSDERPPANLVFLIDVSGSMQSPDKLPLLKTALRLLVDQLDARDRVSIVVYAGASGVVLEPTRGNERRTILDALERLEAGGSTNGAAGIRDAYALARSAFVADGVNRVVLATDGDFNVGTIDFEALIDLVERERESGVAVTTLGFGTGNLNDRLLERLADAGNGNYAYIDTVAEARKVLVEQLSGTLVTIARDVKVQVEFNPDTVLEYRLIGYENRALARADFNNDRVDAGEIGAGHRVTALYEIVPAGVRGRVDALRYGRTAAVAPDPGMSGEIAFLRLRYKLPRSEVSRLIEQPVFAHRVARAGRESPDFRFAASVAAFGQRLRGGRYLGDFDYADIHALGAGAMTSDRGGYRGEFLELVALARTLEGAGETQVSRIETR